MDKASFVSRLVAWIVDVMVIGIISWILSIVLGALGGSDGFVLGLLAAIVFFVALFLQFLYYGYLWSKDGQSLGMKLTNIRVVRRHHSGESISFLRAGLRGTFGYWLSALVFGLGYLWAVLDVDKETWHDKIFDTWVETA